MNNLKLIVGILLLSVFQLKAQTKNQIIVTNIMNNVFENKVKFNPKLTRKITSKEAIKLIRSNPNLSKKKKEALVYDYFTKKEKKEIPEVQIWTTLFQVDGICGPMKVFISYINGKKTYIDLFILPESTASKNCSDIYTKLREVFFGPILGTKNIKRVERKICVPLGSKKHSSCVNVITFVDENANVNLEDECSSRNKCPYYKHNYQGSSNSDALIFDYTIKP